VGGSVTTFTRAVEVRNVGALLTAARSRGSQKFGKF